MNPLEKGVVAGRERAFVVEAEAGVSPEHVEWAKSSRPFQEWRQNLDPRFGVNKVTIQSIDFRGKPALDRVLFVKMKVAGSGLPFEQIVMLRGHSVAMLVVLRCEGKEYVAVTRQPRAAIGEYKATEIPAGMLDNGRFAGQAALEIKEELGLEIAESDLVSLTDRPISTSQGLLDEKVQFFALIKNVPKEELGALIGKKTGEEHMGESIVVDVVPLEQLLEVAAEDGKANIAFLRYFMYLEKQKIAK